MPIFTNQAKRSLLSFQEVKIDMVNSILITGGGSGIGAALAIALSKRNCNVIVAGRRNDALATVAKSSPNIIPHVADVTNQSDQLKLSEALAELPAPRAVFHNAGYFQIGHLDNLSTADWQRSFDTIVTSRWVLSKLCAPHLDRGRILFIGSDSGVNPRSGAAAYSIAQSASETLRRALQAEWADRDIAIAGFKPGLVDTDMVKGFLSKSETEFPSRATYQAHKDRGKITSPETVATFARWLLLDVSADRFSTNEWDIRHPEHQSEWLDGPLYPSAS